MSPSRTLLADYIHHPKFEDYVDDHLSSDSVFMREQHPDANSPSSDASIPDLVALHHQEASSSSAQDDAVLHSPDTYPIFCPYNSPKVKPSSSMENQRIKCIPSMRRFNRSTVTAVAEQRLMNGREQRQCDQTLSECTITKDSALHLVGRRKNSWHPEAWQVIDDLVSTICRLCKGEEGVCTEFAKSKLMEFVSMTPRSDVGLAVSHLSIFTSYCVPEALVMLYKSPDKRNKVCAVHSIQDGIM